MARGKFRVTAQVDATVDEVTAAGYDALTLVGGPGALEHLDTRQVHALFRDAAAAGKVIGAICISPVVLAHAGLLNGKRAACWPDGASEIEKNGGNCTGADLEIDGKIVTASGPLPASKYGRALLELLK